MTDQTETEVLRDNSCDNLKNLSLTPIPQQELLDKSSVTFFFPEKIGNEIEEESLNKMTLSPTTLINSAQISDIENYAENDYSVSASAKLRKKSSKRSSKTKKKRSSSFNVEDDIDDYGNPMRRPSALTSSSGETVISIDAAMREDFEDDGTQEQIFEKLKIHKEVLNAVKYRSWSLRKKVKMVKQAKSYISKHEGALQERLAQSKNTRDALARIAIFTSKKWQYFKRELINLQTWLVPWESRVKEIESHFGSAVASYFTFLRWLFCINLVIFLTLTIFVAIPEILTADKNRSGDRKILLPDESKKSTYFLTLWEFEGVLKHSPFFYGWYTDWDSNKGYRLPLAYFLANLIVYTYSFVAILRKMAINSRMSKLSEKEDECAFTWKLFTGWDFMIGNPETAHNRVASIILGFKESLLEEAERHKKLGHWKITTIRIFVNLFVILLLTLSAYAVVVVVARSTQESANSSWWRQNEITVVMSLISYIFPIFFEVLGYLENYHPRKQLRLQLGRIMVLNLLNLYSLIIALFDKISQMEEELQSLKPKIIPDILTANINTSHCQNILVPCSDMYHFDMQSSSPLTGTTGQSLKRPSILTTSLTALSLILMSNTTTENFFSYQNVSVPQVNDTFYDLTTVSKIFNDSSTDLYNTSKTLTVESSSFFDNVKWEGYIEKDIPQNNYEYYDADGLSYGDESNLTQVKNVTNILINKQYANDSTGNYEENTTILILEPKENIGFEVEENITLVIDNNQENFNNTCNNGDVKIIKCFTRVCNYDNNLEEKKYKTTKVTQEAISKLNITTKKKLRKLCWETMFGQELTKLTVMDLVLTIIMTLSLDFFRALFVRYMNPWWCWDLEKQFPQYGDFKIAENILHLVNNQGMVWMGMFFSPGLIALNLIKLVIIMYLRSWAVMTCNVPHEVVFRASRSNNFYLALLLTMIFLCVLPVGYAIVWVEPSWHCGPFSGYYRIYHIATQSLKNSLPVKVHKSLDYIASPGIIIPLIVLMALIIYYLTSLAGALREANNDLKIQLHYERRKVFKVEEEDEEEKEKSFAKWKKILPRMSSIKSVTPIHL
ncbi:Similar to Tmc3: Transmembrane channel-like protein 3 (Gallus gallus) [Cotesia congregata]|uniref:Similar to Tmc3: Transmembrane channel-like protein 3 (Gallus gallus) n=1 Tax=Cotesia congregata TaxID=51543 RepID=A0A8J2H8W6_COTCN|nr:Similar to Tmc3: Transmembrane channel-like protein 3 (Gallus gallus) [Cotesia congregata]